MTHPNVMQSEAVKSLEGYVDQRKKPEEILPALIEALSEFGEFTLDIDVFFHEPNNAFLSLSALKALGFDKPTMRRVNDRNHTLYGTRQNGKNRTEVTFFIELPKPTEK